MATTAIHDACEAGALAGMLSGRYQTATTAGDYANLVAEAKAIATEFIAVNTAHVGAAIADGVPGSIAQVVGAVAQGVVAGRPAVTEVQPPVDADYVSLATTIYAVAAEAKAAGGLT